MPIYIYTAGKSYIQTEILKENNQQARQSPPT
jgi:hypothetical protein